MSNNQANIFAAIEGRANHFGGSWYHFYTEISQHLPETYHPELKELSNQLKDALERLVSDLHSPTLTLATTGTTSSGKSTLVNLLCGAEIMPMAVAEMSAGVVIIEYSQEETFLEIKETPGATWECGKWQGISEEEIYRRLYDVMINYIDRKDSELNLACPQAFVRYPFRLKSKLQLPEGTTVRIMDLPGLAYVGDEGNASVIRQCREALCLVTYNSAEVDKHKVNKLLQEVVEQVKELAGSPARMLFVLNRIDVFRSDKTWPESEQRFIKNTVDRIQVELTARLQEYTNEIKQLQVSKLSSWAGLLAIQIQSEDMDYSNQACEKADNNFNGLVDKEILKDLHRLHEQWSEHDRKRVADALWKESYAGEFEQTLIEHIAQHFPRLVIPQMIDRFKAGAGNAVTEWAIQTTTAILNSSEERYQQELKKLKKIREAIDKCLKSNEEKLRDPFQDIQSKFQTYLGEQSQPEDASGSTKSDRLSSNEAESSEDREGEKIVTSMAQTLSDLIKDEPYNVLQEKLYPLYQWPQEIKEGINTVLESVAKSLEDGTVDLSALIFYKADRDHMKLLDKQLRRLIDLGYTGSRAKNGKNLEARDDGAKQEIKRLNDGLNDLAEYLNLVMQDILNKIGQQEFNRMNEAVSELFQCHLSYLEKEVNQIASNLAIAFPESQLNQLDGQLNVNVQFKAGFAVTPGNWEEAVQVEKKKRVWYKLWLGTRTYYETEYKTRSSDNANIPSTEDLLGNWIFQTKNEVEPKIANQIIGWLLKQIDSLTSNVDKVQKEIIDRYESRLEQANRELELDLAEQKNIWEPMQEKAESLGKELTSMNFEAIYKVLNKDK